LISFIAEKACLQRQGVSAFIPPREHSPDNVIYVGDETRDIEACHKVGIPIISVTWGLNNNKKSSLACSAQQLARSPKEIISCINQIISQRI
jgi:phosphoglycolate phosphatase-like HAD superfamily hydrolase